MPYDPKTVRDFYDVRTEKEWSRLERDPMGRLIYEVHAKAIRDAISRNDRVLELGAGAGRFSKDIAELTPHLTITDISQRQLEFNQKKLTDLGLADRVEAWLEADICDLSRFEDGSFDTVICIGGALNYVFEREERAFGEMVRVLRPEGVLLLGVMSLAGIIRQALAGVVVSYTQQGSDAIDWLLRTGKQDEIHYTGVAGHRVHMMRRSDILELCDRFNATVEKTYCGGFLATAHPEALQKASEVDDRLWEQLVEAEISLCESPGLLEAGTHMIFLIRK